MLKQQFLRSKDDTSSPSEVQGENFWGVFGVLNLIVMGKRLFISVLRVIIVGYMKIDVSLSYDYLKKQLYILDAQFLPPIQYMT